MSPRATSLMQRYSAMVHISAVFRRCFSDVIRSTSGNPYIILPEVSKQAESDEVPVRAQKGAVRLLHLAVLQQNGILGEQAQRCRVHQKHRQAELMGQAQELFH